MFSFRGEIQLFSLDFLRTYTKDLNSQSSKAKLNCKETLISLKREEAKEKENETVGKKYLFTNFNFRVFEM